MFNWIRLIVSSAALSWVSCKTIDRIPPESNVLVQYDEVQDTAQIKLHHLFDIGFTTSLVAPNEMAFYVATASRNGTCEFVYPPQNSTPDWWRWKPLAAMWKLNSPKFASWKDRVNKVELLPGKYLDAGELNTNALRKVTDEHEAYAKIKEIKGSKNRISATMAPVKQALNIDIFITEKEGECSVEITYWCVAPKAGDALPKLCEGTDPDQYRNNPIVSKVVVISGGFFSPLPTDISVQRGVRQNENSSTENKNTSAGDGSISNAITTGHVPPEISELPHVTELKAQESLANSPIQITEEEGSSFFATMLQKTMLSRTRLKLESAEITNFLTKNPVFLGYDFSGLSPVYDAAKRSLGFREFSLEGTKNSANINFKFDKPKQYQHRKFFEQGMNQLVLADSFDVRSIDSFSYGLKLDIRGLSVNESEAKSIIIDNEEGIVIDLGHQQFVPVDGADVVKFYEQFESNIESFRDKARSKEPSNEELTLSTLKYLNWFKSTDSDNYIKITADRSNQFVVKINDRIASFFKTSTGERFSRVLSNAITEVIITPKGMYVGLNQSVIGRPNEPGTEDIAIQFGNYTPAAGPLKHFFVIVPQSDTQFILQNVFAKTNNPVKYYGKRLGWRIAQNRPEAYNWVPIKYGAFVSRSDPHINFTGLFRGRINMDITQTFWMNEVDLSDSTRERP